MQVDFLRDGEVRLAVIESDKGGHGVGREVFSTMLADAKAPRGARPAKSPGVWRRVRERASNTWHWIRRDHPDDDDDEETPVTPAQQPAPAPTQAPPPSP